MDYKHSLIEDLRSSLDAGETSREKLFLEATRLAKGTNSEINAFVTIIEDDEKESDKKTILTDIPYALKDNYSTKDILTTASSNILKNYIPPYNATVYQKLEDAGATLIGKTVLDELAMGGTGTTGHTGATKNPWDTNRMIGGSSSGSCAAVALGIVPFSLGSDTGDSVRKPAAYGGVVGFKPTYGRISRYGLFAFASSLDHVGVFTRSVKDAAIVTDILKGFDPYDMTSLKDENIMYAENLDRDINGKKLFYIKEAFTEKEVENFNEVIKKCESLGMSVTAESIDVNVLNALYPTYMAISCAEATSNNSNLTGIPFGVRGEGKNISEIITDARTKGFSELIRRRFVIGSYVLQKENQEKLFKNSCRIRRMIVDKMNELFKTYDALIMPTSGDIAPLFGEKSDRLSSTYLILENHLVIGNFGGFPSISVPSGMVKNMPVSVNITGPAFKDSEVLNIAYKLEETLGMKGVIVGDKNV